MPRRIRPQQRLVLLVLLVLLKTVTLSTLLTAQEQGLNTLPDQQALVRALQQGGYVIYFRHAATEHDQIDAEQVDFTRCETQRNLSAIGRAQMRDIGQAFQTLGILVAQVLTSPYCRCIDSGQLAFGKASIVQDLRFVIREDAAETARMAAVLRTILAHKPPQGSNIVVIAHTANLKEATGIWPKPEGGAYVFQPDGKGGFVPVGAMPPDVWIALASVK
jgi:phosphohistidine phosphatase SixA